MVSVEEEIESEKNVETEEDKGESSDTRVVEVMRDLREADSRPNEIVSEQTVFKVPLKRKKTDKVHDYRQQKKIDLKDVTEHMIQRVTVSYLTRVLLCHKVSFPAATMM